MASRPITARRPRRRTDRVGIVGAGVSGLTAAHFLRQAGYEDVIVLERDTRVGGKCCSFRADDHVFELGAVLGTRDYTITRELMRSVGVRGDTAAGLQCHDVDGRETPLFRRWQIPQLLWLFVARYAWPMQVKYRTLRRPGLAGISPDLTEPFEQYAQRHGLPAFEHAVSPPFTGFGYGYFDDVPTAYVMKYLDVPMVEAMAVPSRCFIWPEGAEQLWARLAEQHDVRTGTSISSVTRGHQVEVHTDQGDLELDALILTCPLDESLQFLDASPTEQRLFSAIRTYDYWVLLCELADPPPRSGYLPANFTHERAGHLMIWYRPWPEFPLATLYALGDGSIGHREVTHRCAQDLERMGAGLRRVVAVRRWKYFPHVSPADMAAGFYDEIEAMQGMRGTYYAGEVMSFSTIEICARYSRALVQRFFPS